MASRGEALKTYTIRHKLENFHVYFWILKDFAWTSDDRPLAWFSGILALAYLVGLVGFAFRIGDYEETYMLTGTFLWLFGNFWWMAGEVGMFGSDEKNTPQAGFIFAFAILWPRPTLKATASTRASTSTAQSTSPTSESTSTSTRSSG
ncbi:hypothetical protein M885DRAFT_2697 [Pelagophyceae sp. CCMP2097]|nr:hypothetical protein M885DRAFT_2697 [Pelagophyceae sp. CCMP2097]